MTTHLVFHRTLTEFLQGLVQCFPEHNGAAEALGMLQALPVNQLVEGMLVGGWSEVAIPVKDAIFKHDAGTVVEAFEQCKTPMIAKLDVRSILLAEDVDEETMMNIWLFITTLTTLSIEYNNPPEHAEDPKPRRMPAPGEVSHAVPPPAAQAAPTPPKPDIKNLVEGFTSAMPQVVQSLNQVLKSKDGEENPLGDLIRGMLNPQSGGDLRPGVTNNVLANMMGSDEESVMQQAAMDNGLTVDEITEKLRKLEMYEKLRAKRKGTK